MSENASSNIAEFRLHRSEKTNDTTFGLLKLDGSPFCCHTLEDIERKVKIPGITAIPCGRFPIRTSMSPRFKRITVEVMKVPNFLGIRCHRGTNAKDTEGCQIVGWQRVGDKLTLSRSCETALTELVSQLERNGVQCFLTITSDFEPI